MKDVVISIRGTQRSFHPGQEEQRPESVELVTDGRYEYGRDASWFTYHESEITGMEGTRTSLMVLPDKVVVDRDGLVTSRMIFTPGQRSAFQYDTPVGTATMQMDTHSITQRFDERGGDMEIDYVLGLEHAVISRNRFRLNVREQTAPRTYAAQ